MIKLFQPYVPVEVINELSNVLHSGCITQGQKVEEFEKNFSNVFNVKYPVSVNSGTSSLELAYDLVGLQEGDEVITTPLTCAATNIPLLHKKVKIVWADIDPDTLCIDCDSVRMKITDKTKAIVQVHLGGVESKLRRYTDTRMSKSSLDFDIPIISDACQALGIFKGDYTCCSFQAIKHFTTGDGGMLVVNNEKDYKKAKLMRWFGVDRERKIPNDWTSYRTRMMSFDIELLGYKKHMNDIDAAMGIIGLRHYNKVLQYRKTLFDLYKKLLNNLDGIKIVDGEDNVYWLFTVLVERRDDFAKMLYEAGIESNLVQVRNDGYKVFGGKKADLPNLASIENKYLSLPIGMHVSKEDVHYICSRITKGW